MTSLALLLAQTPCPAPAADGLTAAGATLMTLCILLVCGLNLFCLSRILLSGSRKS